MERKKIWVFITILFVVCVILGLVSSSREKDSGVKVVMKETTSESEKFTPESEEVTEDEGSSVTFTTEGTFESKLLKSCNVYISSLFSNSNSDMSVSESIADEIESKVSAISPQGGYISRMVNIEHSGLSDLENGVYEYIAISKVYCIDMSSRSYSYDVVIVLSVSEVGVVEDFTLYMF